MTSILKKQLMALCGAVVLGGALLGSSGNLWAQNEGPKLTRDQAAVRFANMMNGGFYSSSSSRRQLEGVISHKSDSDLRSGATALLAAMISQWKQPDQIVKVQNEGDKSATVVVEDDPKPPVRPLILIEEDGGWGVDLVETYALWNHLEGVEKAKAIYTITGVALDDLPRDAAFLRQSCDSNLRQLGLGLLQYTQDYDERFPLAKKWVDEVRPYVRNEELFTCPAVPQGKKYGYAYNAKLSGKALANIENSSTLPALYETNALKRNAYGMGEDIAFRHDDGAHYDFVDGHAKWYSKAARLSFNLGK